MITFKQHYVTELFQSMPAMDTMSEWQVGNMGASASGTYRFQDVRYVVNIKGKTGRSAEYTYYADVVSQVPGKRPSAREIREVAPQYRQHLPGAEVSFKAIHHDQGEVITMTGDADVSAVLNHALAFIKDLIAEYKLNLISFAASNKELAYGYGPEDNKPEDAALHSDSRAKVYERLIKRFADQLGFTYTVKTVNAAQPGAGMRSSTKFLLTRKSK